MIQRFNWEIFNVTVGLRLRKWDEQVSWISAPIGFSIRFLTDLFTYKLQHTDFTTNIYHILIKQTGHY